MWRDGVCSEVCGVMVCAAAFMSTLQAVSDDSMTKRQKGT